MEDPKLYHRAEFLKSDLTNFFNEYKPLIRLRSDGTDSLLDIGCAGGNVTVDVIQPILPYTFSRLVGIDISEPMVRYANQLFAKPRVSFEVLDIGTDITHFLDTHERFDHVTSSLCLHLVPDQEQCLKNIFNLLQPTGDCLLYILVDCFVFDIYVKMSMDRKWSKYMDDIDDYISPYYRKVNPEYLLRKHLKAAGFAQYDVKLRTQTLVYDDVQKFKEHYQSVLPFYHRMSPSVRDECMEEFAKLAQEMTPVNCGQLNGNQMKNGGAKILAPYKLMTAFAKKN